LPPLPRQTMRTARSGAVRVRGGSARAAVWRSSPSRAAAARAPSPSPLETELCTADRPGDGPSAHEETDGPRSCCRLDWEPWSAVSAGSLAARLIAFWLRGRGHRLRSRAGVATTVLGRRAGSSDPSARECRGEAQARPYARLLGRPASCALERRQAVHREQTAYRADSPANHRRACQPSSSIRSRPDGRSLRALLTLYTLEKALLVIYAVHLAGRSSQQRHRTASRIDWRPLRAPRAEIARTPAREAAITRAAGSRRGERSGFRPLARGWASPSRRPFNRRPVSQGTHL